MAGMTEYIRSARDRAVEYIAPALPQNARERVVGANSSWSYADLVPVARAGGEEKNLLIARTNSASQAVLWGKAAEGIPGVSASSLAFSADQRPVVLRADTEVKYKVGTRSRVWARRQRRQILAGFTHVLYEAEKPILPALYGGDLLAEIADLQDHGVKVAMVAHGSDVRIPSRHRQLEPYSPFASDLDGLTAVLEESATKNVRGLSELEVPKFISTLDLTNYVEGAEWLPTLADASTWEALAPPDLGEHKLRVLHVPSNSALKGTVHVRAAMNELAGRGEIEYREAEDVPHSEMPRLVEWADLVIDQLTMGLYGVASIEAMLAGRLVVAQAGSHIRDETLRRTGCELPILEADPGNIQEIVSGVAADPRAFLPRAEAGRGFAQTAHSEERAAEALRDFLTG